MSQLQRQYRTPPIQVQQSSTTDAMVQQLAGAIAVELRKQAPTQQQPQQPDRVTHHQHVHHHQYAGGGLAEMFLGLFVVVAVFMFSVAAVIVMFEAIASVDHTEEVA